MTLENVGSYLSTLDFRTFLAFFFSEITMSNFKLYLVSQIDSHGFVTKVI